MHMKRIVSIAAIWAVIAGFATAGNAEKEEKGFIPLFDGKSLKGWKVAENPKSVTVEDGMIVCQGPRAHMFYEGPVNDNDFKNFILRMDVMTTTGSNSGVFFHTEYVPSGAVKKGYEAQINTSHSDPVKTGSLFAVEHVMKAASKDGEWFKYEVSVRGKRIVTRVNGKTIVDYTEPENPKRPAGREQRVLSSGTIALQAHDPAGVKVFFKNVRIKPLPD